MYLFICIFIYIHHLFRSQAAAEEEAEGLSPEMPRGGHSIVEHELRGEAGESHSEEREANTGAVGGLEEVREAVEDGGDRSDLGTEEEPDKRHVAVAVDR